MKQVLLICLLLMPFNFIFSSDYSKIDEQSYYVPYQLKTPPEIAKYLTRNLRNDEEKVRAIYFWTANNIRYDVNQIPGTDYRYHVANNRNFLQEVLTSHKGVCQHYAMLFDTLCRSVGIKSYLIIGYTFQNKQISTLSHAWNAVMINGNYFDLDVTWSAGYIEDNKFREEFHDDFYMVAPSKFITTHIPFDPVWQFLNNPVNHYDVLKGDFSAVKKRGNFNYSDSLKAIANRDTLTNQMCENLRIQHAGATNELIKNYVDYNKWNIDLSKYNSAVKDFRKSVGSYNKYIGFKNKQFNNCMMADDSIQNSLATTADQLNNVKKELKYFNEDNDILGESIGNLQRAIKRLDAEIRTENLFIKRYISTAKQSRLALFTVQNSN